MPTYLHHTGPLLHDVLMFSLVCLCALSLLQCVLMHATLHMVPDVGMVKVS